MPREKSTWRPPRGERTKAEHRDGPIRTSDEGRSCGRSKGVGPSGCRQRPTGNRRRPWGQQSRRLLGGSGVSREAAAPFCERPEVKLLRPTRHESFNVLKNRGYHLEHNFGHGQKHLAALLACFNLLAFAIHTVCELASGAWRHARETLGPRARFFQNLQGLTSYLVFSCWTELLETLALLRPSPRPP